MARSKEFLLGCLVGGASSFGLFFFIVGIAVSMFSARQSANSFRQIAEALLPSGEYDSPEMGVRVNQIGLSGTAMWESPGYGDVTSLASYKNAAGELMIAAGASDRIRIIHADTLNVVSEIAVEEEYERLELLHVNGQDPYIYTAATWGLPAALFHPDGTLAWSYSIPYGTNIMVPVKIHKDGPVAFAIGGYGEESLHLVDFSGALVWKEKEESIFNIAPWDVDDDGDQEIVHNNDALQFILREGDGSELKRMDIDQYFEDFTVVPRPGHANGSMAVGFEFGDFFSLNAAGEVIRVWKVPNADYYDTGKFAIVRLEPGDEQYLAALLTDYMDSSSMICVMKADGTLLYQEVIDPAFSMCVIDTTENGGAGILLGGYDRIMRYSLAGPNAGERAEVPSAEAVPSADSAE